MVLESDIDDLGTLLHDRHLARARLPVIENARLRAEPAPLSAPSGEEKVSVPVALVTARMWGVESKIDGYPVSLDKEKGKLA